ncbi:MAG: DUF4445 domain-containing protein [Nitrospiraceae bacterium]|nr:DUF4445 domain-containing protein [Nitrospiraceae bacterium]
MDRLDPVARVITLDLPRPTLDDNRSHESRIRSALEDSLGHSPQISLNICRDLPNILPGSGYKVGALVLDGPCGWELGQVSAGSLRPYGLAVDLGSTTLVFYLVDLVSGKIISTISKTNPQRVHGEDILERILFAGRDNGLQILQSALIDLFNSSIQEITAAKGLRPKDIFFITVAGNTTMCHFFLGLNPAHICKEPYIPVANSFDMIRPQEIGIDVHPQAWLYCFPNVGSYFGGDLLAGILISGMHQREEISMLIDVGTNAEVILGNRDWLVACAGAAGPALEGGILSCGMRAQPGAIERVDIDPDSLALNYRTIGKQAPKGLCGSAIIDLLAAMFLGGLVDPTGKLVRDRDRSRIQQQGGEWVYVVAGPKETGTGKPVYLSQSDIKNLIRSKGAMYTILSIVVQNVGIGFEDIDTFYIAGAFGNYVDPQKAITIGMLPDIPIGRFKGLGNAAGNGAIEALRWRKARKEIEEIRNKITYLEMNVRGDFMSQLTGALFLPHTDLTRFPSVKEMIRGN